MGLFDSILGGSGSGGSSATSPLTKALLVMLAAKAASSYFGSGSSAPSTPPAPAGGGAAQPGGQITSGALAGLPSLDSILGHFKQAGHEETAKSWIGPGQNAPIAPHDLPAALGPQAIDHLQQASGLPRDQLLQQLSALLPQIIDKLTPNGRLPTQDERAHW